LERDKQRLELKEMSRYVAKLCQDKERLVSISKERIGELENELA